MRHPNISATPDTYEPALAQTEGDAAESRVRLLLSTKTKTNQPPGIIGRLTDVQSSGTRLRMARLAYSSEQILSQIARARAVMPGWVYATPFVTPSELLTP